MSALVPYAAGIFATQWVAFVPAALFKSEKFYDLVGSLTYVGAISTALLTSNGATGAARTRFLVNGCMVLVWAVRLGSYLFHRVMKAGKDARFAKVVTNPRTFFIYWTVQGLWVFLMLLPHLIPAKSGPGTEEESEPTRRDYIGWAGWVLGFLIESLADSQKSAFRANPANEGRFISTGLWGIVQHPNYLGEIMMWASLWISRSSGYSAPSEYATILSPIFLAFLLTKMSGIPPLQRLARKRWGEDKDWQAYFKSTPLLIPFVW